MRLTFDDYVLDVARRELWRGSEPIAVEPQVFDLLVYLVQNPDRVISRDELLQAVWDGRVVSESAINNRVNAARRAIGDSGEAQRLILTVPRKGFRFVKVVKELGADVTKAAVPLHSARSRGIPRALFVATASALLSVAITAFLLWPGAGPLSSLPAGVVPGQTPIPTSGGDLRLPIAVLPLTAHDGGADQADLAASITEGLTTELSRNSGLFVTLRHTASFDLDKPRQIGRGPPARYILDGSVERANGEIRVTARLADAETGEYLWADHYDRAVGNRLDLEDEIVGRIVNAIGTALVLREADRAREHTDAAHLIWRGRALMRTVASRKTVAEAVEVLERALEIQPGSVSAEIQLANTLAISTVGPFQINGAERLRRAEHLIDAAVAAAPNSAGAHYSKAQVLRLQGRYEAAIGEYEMTIALNRNATNAYDMLGDCKLIVGAIGDVIPLEERAIRLDPSDSFAGGYYQRIGIVELFQSHIGQAISLFEKARTAYATRQNEWGVRADSWLAAAYALNGETSRAANALAEARKSDEYPASIAQYRRQTPWLTNSNVRAVVEATYFNGLRLAGLPEE
jgi:DNA-binding winged helix-turn-helix (wHTH) protein/TolB-like protein